MKEIYTWTVSGPWSYENTATDTEYKLTVDAGIVSISFQGSGSKLDWLQNFRFARRAYKRMENRFYAHVGFLKKYHSVRDQILLQVRQAQGHTIRVHGFSQGAALATLCYEDMKFHFPTQDIYGFAFGSPRVLWKPNAKIRARFTGLINVQNGNDIVCKVPPTAFGYRHVGDVRHIGPRLKRGKLSVADHTRYLHNL